MFFRLHKILSVNRSSVSRLGQRYASKWDYEQNRKNIYYIFVRLLAQGQYVLSANETLSARPRIR